MKNCLHLTHLYQMNGTKVLIGEPILSQMNYSQSSEKLAKGENSISKSFVLVRNRGDQSHV